jgi:hypothetical protein
MKLQIILRTFWAPIVLLAFLFIKLESGYTAFKIFAAIVFLASILFSRLLSDLRYIREFTISGDIIHINYVNQFLINKSIELPLKNITGLKLSKKHRINLWSPTLVLKLDQDRLAFNILSDDLYHEIQHQLDSANLNSFQNSLATQ